MAETRLNLEIESEVRGAERVDKRERERLSGIASRLETRLKEADELRVKVAGAVDESATRAKAVALRVGTSRLDALRVRAAALRHERESLTEHMELLEEHLARLKADLEYKQSEVSEVAHQWEAAKAKLPALRQRQAGSEQMRANLQQIVAVLKAHLLKHNKNKLPKQLLQQLDPMERQQLEEAAA